MISLARDHWLGRDHEVDVAAPEFVERVIGGACGVDADVAQLIAPGQRRRLLLEGADRLPSRRSAVAIATAGSLRGAALPEPPDRHTNRVWRRRPAGLAATSTQK